VNDRDLLDLHRTIVSVPSRSGGEGAICDFLAGWLADRGVQTGRVGNSLFASIGERPVVCLNTHIDTVPEVAGWTRPPFRATVEGGRVYGLGSNDAKASVAAMAAAFVRLRDRGVAHGVGVVLTLVEGEETDGGGTRSLLPELARRGMAPAAVVVGEPTGLDVVVAQKGRMVLELSCKGDSCHAAHGRALGARNAIAALARDLAALADTDLGQPDPLLGPATLEPTLVSGGVATNVVPGEATCTLDVRTNPGSHPGTLVARLREVVAGDLRVVGDPAPPCHTDRDHPLVRAALAARPAARLAGSRGLSDWVFFQGVPGIKVGPGRTERSHTADEYVLADEVIEGACFYERLVLEWAPSPCSATRPPPR